MLISSLRIKNYRGLDINIDTIEKVSIIIGQNDSSKLIGVKKFRKNFSKNFIIYKLCILNYNNINIKIFYDKLYIVNEEKFIK